MKVHATWLMVLGLLLGAAGLAVAAEDKAGADGKVANAVKNAVKAGADKVAPAKIVTDEDKISYIIGVQLGENFKAQGLQVSPQLLARGIMDALAGSELAIAKKDHQGIFEAYRKKMEAQARAKMKAEGEKRLGDKAWKLNLKKPDLMKFDAQKDYFWVLDTNKGEITIKLMPEVAPMHVTSTIFLTRKGFYDGLTFHRVIPGFMAQGGCPLGTGTGGPGYEYDGEFSDKVKHDRPYLLSMANAGPGTDGSQFFLTFKATPWLDGKHTIFGEITEGKEVMKKLEAAGSPDGKPKEPLIINKATIVEKAK